MNHEIRHLSIYRHEAYLDAVMAPAHGLADYLLRRAAEFRARVAKGFESWMRAREIAATMKELSRLEDHVLRDIGVDRDNIYAVSVAVVDDPKIDLRELASR